MTVEPPAEPKPQPPREPLPQECCGGGCSPCVYDRYSDAVERYREALRLWQSRHPSSGPVRPTAGE